MQKELGAVKTVLGPWYRGPETGRSGGVGAGTAAGNQVVSPDMAYAEELAAFVEESSTDLNIASYFPPVEADFAQAMSPIDNTPSQHHQHRASTSFTAAPPSSYRSRPPPAIPINLLTQPLPAAPAPLSHPTPSTSSSSPVAPLNISTTLYGTLSSLHTSLLTLSSSLDSLGRHQDVALTTETMRMGEEVRSLRGVVSGLRMQVHAIMVDRNSQVTGRPVGATTGETMPGPVSATTLQQHPGHQYPQFQGIPGVGESGPWPAPTYFGLPLPRFPPQGASSQPVTKL